MSAGGAPRRVVAYVPDLMDRSRFARATGGGGAEVRFVGSPAELADVVADLVVADLARPGALAALGAVGVPTVGFAPHVDDELLAEARSAGVHLVLARSAFFRRLPELLTGGAA